MRKDKKIELEESIRKFKTRRVMEKENVSSHFLTVEIKDYELNNGKVITREKILKNKKDGDAVIIVPITKNQEWIMVIEPRVHTKEQVGIGFPAGYIEKEESPILAAKRELQEETGYQAETLEVIDGFYQDEGCSSSYNTIVLATGCVKISKQMLDEGEFIHYFLCSQKEAYELLKEGWIQGVNSKYALLKMKNIWK